MATKNIVRNNTYLDSIMLMSISNQLRELPEIDEVSLIMGTSANKSILKNIGLLTPEGEKADPCDLIIALRVKNEGQLGGVIENVERLISHRAGKKQPQGEPLPRNIDGALKLLPEANLVLVSLPGEYATDAAMDALENGRHVMIFSDNVPLQDEIRLKKRAGELGLLVMGPDCGTAVIGGLAVGFANVVRRGSFGIAGASGTGIQEISTLLHKRGYGISHAIGLGGRDLSREVGGLSMLQAVAALEDDPGTDTVILLSKPPAPEIARLILDTVRNLQKNYVVNFLQGSPEEARKLGLPFAAGLEEAVELAISVKEKRAHVPVSFTGDEPGLRTRARGERKKIGTGGSLRGLFSGGTLADEALLLLSGEIGDIHSNIPLRDELKLKNSWESIGHTIVDMGDDQFTRGRPHPMIDYSLRIDRLLREAADRRCAVVLLDVVLGYGAHEDPSAALAPAIEKARRIADNQGRYVCFVASVTGTSGDPQNYEKQKSALEKAGVVVLPSNAQAARFSALLLKAE
jgi:FdrA protein